MLVSNTAQRSQTIGYVAFTCGGTGGHVYPVIALAQAIGKEQCLFIGSSDRPDSDIIPRYGFRHESVPYSSRNIGKMLSGFLNARRILKTEKPNLLVSSGGALTFGVVLAARSLGIPVILLEQNALPGRVTRVLAHLAEYVCTSFAESHPYLPSNRIRLTGNPIRSQYPPDPVADALCQIHFGQTNVADRPTLLIFGGSQGAKALNDCVMQSLDQILYAQTSTQASTQTSTQTATQDSTHSSIQQTQHPRFNVIHVTGEAQYDAIVAGYTRHMPGRVNRQDRLTVLTCRFGYPVGSVIPYIEAMDRVYQKSDIVISRAGATTLAELAHFGKPAVLIPYPHAKDDHQRFNAEAFITKYPGSILPETELSVSALIAQVETLLKNTTPSHPKKSVGSVEQDNRQNAVSQVLSLMQLFYRYTLN